MVDALAREVWDELRDLVGEDLRVVTRYEGMEYGTVMRDDVREQYSAHEDRAIIDDTIVKQLGLNETEGAFKTGHLQAIVRVFEDAWVASVPDGVGEKSGFIVSIQREREATMDDMDACIRWIHDRMASRTD